MSSPAVHLHVERTGRPDVLRWVCRLGAVADGSHRPPRCTALRSLIEDGVIDTVSVHDDDLLIRFARPREIDDPTTVAVVHRAVAAALSDTAWLRRPASTDVHIRTR